MQMKHRLEHNAVHCDDPITFSWYVCPAFLKAGHFSGCIFCSVQERCEF